MSIPPPATLLSPWWPQYQSASDLEYKGHIEAGTWELVPYPVGKNVLRGKWVFDDRWKNTQVQSAICGNRLKPEIWN